ncbi:putative T7SS-secreted protein [Streptomyces sp. NPDC001532]|uniref:putative T7SS-secreted protein n=1 Tax=Streptomyces sp. NPDC001532 TaxID=3154520 RepID=UPI003324C508
MTEKSFRRRAWIAEGDTVQDWIPGKPSDLDELIKKLAGAAAHFGQGAEQLRKLNTDPWQGEAAEVFRDTVKRLPKDLDTALDAFVAAGLAVLAYRNTLDTAQRLTAQIIDHEAPTARELSRTYDKAVTDYDTAVKAGDTAGATKPPAADPGKTLMTELVGRIQTAQGDVEEAAATAKRDLGKAAEKAPNRPSAWSRFKGGAKEAAGEFGDFALAVNPGRLLTEPGAYLHDAGMVIDGGSAAVRDPVAFSKDFYQGASNTWEAFEKDPVRMLGYLAPSLAGGAAVGGSAGLARRLDGVDGAGRATGLGTGAGHLDGSEPGTHSEPGRRTDSDPTDPVDLATGRMYLPQTDVTLPGTLHLVFRRRAESGYRAGRWFGPSWSNTVDQRLEIDAERVVFLHENGLILAYPHPEPGGEPTLPTEGPRWPLRRAAKGYTITDPTSGRVWHFEDQTDAHARLEQIDDRNGDWITVEYGEDGAPTALTHSGGYRVRITTENHRITALHLAGAAPDGGDQELIRYGYSEGGDLTEVVNSSGRPLRFTYDEAGRITSWTDPNDRGYTYEYDDRDRCVAEGGTAGHMSLRLEYGERDPHTGLRTTTATTGAGHAHRYLVNDLCQVVAETNPLGATTRFVRDRYHRVLSRTDPLGHVTSFRYDEAGNVTSVVRADGRGSTAEYNGLGLPVRVTNTDGTVVLQTYDVRGNKTGMTAPSGETTHFTYNNAGHLTSITDPLGQATAVRCDAAGLPVEITSPLGAITRYERDAFGRPVTITDPTGATTRLEWTVEGRLARRTTADGATESWTYDGEGNCTSHTDPMGGVSHFTYTHFDLLTSRTGPDGVRYDFDHDRELRLTKVTNPQGLTWSYEYDAAGHLRRETDFDDRALTYTYDAAGRLASRTNALGLRVSFERNALGQVIRKNAADQETTFAYDVTDQLAQATGPDGTTLTLSRDQYGRLLSETVDGRTLTYTYDDLGRRAGRTTPTGATTTWYYDAAGRRTGMVASGRAIDFTYDAAGRELTRRIGETVTLEHGFDQLGRLTTQSVTGAGGTRIQHRSYTYRADGNLIGIDDQLVGSRTFDLDPAGRVTAVHAANWTETYAYDAAGNQTSASWPSSHPGAEAVGEREYTGTPHHPSGPRPLRTRSFRTTERSQAAPVRSRGRAGRQPLVPGHERPGIVDARRRGSDTGPGA